MGNSTAFETVVQRLETSRPLIEQLYKQKTLTEVMDIMESQHGVKASLNMYKKRINKWGLDKKNKEGDMRAIVRKKRQRNLAGKSSVFQARGRPIKYEDVVRYWERRRMSIEDVLAMCNSREATPDGLECSTPVPSPASFPAALTVPERILKHIGDYSRASFESGTWISTDPKALCFSSKESPKESIDRLHWFLDQINRAAALFFRGRFNEAGQILVSSTAIIERIVLAEHPSTISKIMHLFKDLYKNGYPEIGMAIIRQIAALSETLLCHGHPTSRIFGSLATMDHSEVLEISRQAQQSMGDLFERVLGFTHISTLGLRALYWSFQSQESMSAAARGSMERCEAELGGQDPRSMFGRSALAFHYLNKGQYDEAEREFWVFLECCNKMGASMFATNVRAEGLYVLGEVYFSRKNVDAGLACLKEAITLRTSTCGGEDSRVRLWTDKMEYSLWQYSKWEATAQIEQWRMVNIAAEANRVQEIEM